jgi:hypothetical protein
VSTHQMCCSHVGSLQKVLRDHDGRFLSVLLNEIQWDDKNVS